MNDLEFLVRCVPEWPNGATHVRLDRDGEVCFGGPCSMDCDFYPANRDEAKSCFNEVGGGANTGPHYSESQWLSERARLQNKPSWDDAPEWAEWLAQDAGGKWNFYEFKPLERGNFWSLSCSVYGKDTRNDYPLAPPSLPANVVLGDWRDTMERRPESVKQIKFPEGVKWMGDTKEWKQGELPPIGEECEVYRNGEWEPCEIIAHIEQPIGTIAVFSYGREPGHGISGVDCLIPRYFRPEDDKFGIDPAVDEKVDLLRESAFTLCNEIHYRPERDSYVTKAEADQYYCDREGECLMNNQHQHASSTEWTGPEQGFPPPGTRCMVMDSGEWRETYIVGMDDEGYCVYEPKWHATQCYRGDSDPQAFYPLTLTDEVNRLEEALSSVDLDRSRVRDIAQCLVAAGYRINSD